MAVKSIAWLLRLEEQNDVGEAPGKVFEESIVQSGFTRRKIETFELDKDAEDEAITFTDAVGLLVFSHTGAFSWRLTADQDLVTGVRFLAWAADDVESTVRETGILLTGNGDSSSDIEVWVIEKA